MAKFAGEQLSLIAEDFEDRPVGDWEWETDNLVLLPNFREQANLVLLPKVREQEQTDLLLPKVREQMHPPHQVREQLHPPHQVREQLLEGHTVIGYSIVTIKSEVYYLTHAKSSKYYPVEGWWDIKKQKGINYLYTRWREGLTQKSRCLGRLDRVE